MVGKDGRADSGETVLEEEEGKDGGGAAVDNGAGDNGGGIVVETEGGGGVPAKEEVGAAADTAEYQQLMSQGGAILLAVEEARGVVTAESSYFQVPMHSHIRHLASDPAYPMLMTDGSISDHQMVVFRHQLSAFSQIRHALMLQEHHLKVSTQSAEAANAKALGGAAAGSSKGGGGGMTQSMLNESLSKSASQYKLVRPRWTPTPDQLSILENMFMNGQGCTGKGRIEKITKDLGRHGPISETNVYNWFQNRKARAKRKAAPSAPVRGVTQAGAGNSERSGKGAHKGGAGRSVKARDERQNKDAIIMVPVEEPALKQEPVQVLKQESEQGLGETDTLPVNMGNENIVEVFIEGKLWELTSGMLDVWTTFGRDVVLMDSETMKTVEVDMNGIVVHPLKSGAHYTVIDQTNCVKIE